MQYEDYEKLIPSFHRYPRRKTRVVDSYEPTFSRINIGTGGEKRWAYFINGINWASLRGRTFRIRMPRQIDSATFGAKVFRVQQDESLVADYEEIMTGKFDGATFELKLSDPFMIDYTSETLESDYYIMSFYFENVENTELSGMRFEEVEEYTPERSDYAEFVKICLQQGVDYANLLDSFLEKFNLNTATGVQLDIIGNLVGASRVLPYAIQDQAGVNVMQLTDEDFRMLIRAKIARNNWDGTMESLARLCSEIFTDYDVSFYDLHLPEPDREQIQNMKYMYIIKGNISNSQRVMIMNDMILPRPAGIQVGYEINNAVETAQIAVASIIGYDYKGAEQVNPVET